MISFGSDGLGVLDALGVGARRPGRSGHLAAVHCRRRTGEAATAVESKFLTERWFGIIVFH